MTPTQRAHNLMELLEDLISLLEKENSILEAPRTTELGPLVAEKEALFKLYGDQMAHVAQDPGFAAALPEDVRASLTEMAEKLDILMKTNARRLEVLAKASTHIVGRITEAAKSAAGNVPQYGAAGKMHHQGAAAPIAMNQEI